jgi:two-component system nitrogen regulation response regulator GlnG
VGGSELIAVDFRVIAASNQRLEALVASGEFRRDLYYRLNEFCIHIPPLREHPEDIPHYCNRFIRGANRELGKNVLGLDEHATAKALAYDWPGNIRELRNVIRRAALVANGMIEAHQLSIPDRPAQAGTAATEPPLSQGQDTLSLKQRVKPMVAELEGRLIRQALELTHGNKARAARLLGVDYKTLQTKIREHGNEMQHDATVEE